MDTTKEEELRDVFAVFDKDGDEFITTDEIHQVMNDLGQSVSEQSVSRMMSAIDLDGSGSIDFEEFKTMWTVKASEINEEKKIRSAFEMFDRNHDQFIDAYELHQLLLKLGISTTEEEAEEMVHLADLNNDNKVDFEEFKNVMFAK